MNESTLTGLKILVERAIRPVRASTGGKRRMREELLAHVTAVCEEESGRGDESTALERTTQRFGAAEELTSQLQAALPAGDRVSWFIESLMGFPPRESALRQATRHALLVGAMCMIGLGIMVVVKGPRAEWLTLARLPAVLTPVYMGVLMFCATLLGRGLSRALFRPAGKDWMRAIALSVVAWMLVPALTFAWSAAISRMWEQSLLETVPLLLTGVLLPVVLLVTIYLCMPEIRHHEEWARLPIEPGAQ
jgi:hypothetical protein